MAQIPGAQPDCRPLKNDKGIVLIALRSRIKSVINRRQINLGIFTEAVLPFHTRQGLRDYLEGKEEESVCMAKHFQMYDWLMLSIDDQERVLRGEPTEHGYFQQRDTLVPGRADNRFPGIATLSLTNDDGRINLQNLARKLDYELQNEQWTRSQFAFRVLREIADGARVARIIEQVPPFEQEYVIYKKIFEWLQTTPNAKEYDMHPIPPIQSTRYLNHFYIEPPIRQPMQSQVYEWLWPFVTEPSSFNVTASGFMQRMKFIAEQYLARLQQVQWQPSTVLYENRELISSQTNALIHFLSHPEPPLFDRRKLYVQLLFERLIPIAFTYRWHLSYHWLADCLEHVLDEHGLNLQEFAPRVLKCSSADFTYFLSRPADLQGINEEVVVGVREYLKLNCEERREAWGEDESEEHRYTQHYLTFLLDPTPMSIYELGFRRILVNRSKQQILALDLAIDNMDIVPIRGRHHLYSISVLLKASSQYLIDYLCNQYGILISGEVWALHRERIINMKFTDGFMIHYDRMARCLQVVLETEKNLERFTRNVLQCSDEDLESFFTSPLTHSQRENGFSQVEKIYSWLTDSWAGRRDALRRAPALQAGAPQDGAPQDGAHGAPQDGAPQDGAPQDGAQQDGAPQDGALQDGAPQDGH